MYEVHDKPAKKLEEEAPSEPLSTWGAACWGAFLAHPLLAIILFVWGTLFGVNKAIYMSPVGASSGRLMSGFAGGCEAVEQLGMAYALSAGIAALIVSFLGAGGGVFFTWLWHRYSGADVPGSPAWTRLGLAVGAFLMLALIIFLGSFLGSWMLDGCKPFLGHGGGKPEPNRYAAADKTIAKCTESLRLNPTDANAYRDRGQAWAERGDYDRAIADLTEAARLDPNNRVFLANAYINRGNGFYSWEKYDSAIASYNEALRVDPKCAAALRSRGEAWRLKEDYDQAIADITEAVRLDKREGFYLANAYKVRGFARASKREYETAIGDYTEALRFAPQERDYHNFRDEVKQAIEKAAAACPLSAWKKPEFIATLAAAYAEADDFAKAVETQQKALDLAPAAQKDAYAARLKLYASGMPLRE